MRVESLRPGEIAGYTDLETIASQNDGIMFQMLDEQASTPDGMSFDDIYFTLPNLLIYASALNHFIHGAYAPPETIATTQRALGLSILISDHLCFPRPCSMSFGTLKDIKDDTERYEYISHAPETYLSNRPTLDTLSGRYLPEISPDPRYHSCAELVMGLTFLQVDEYLFNEFTSERATELTQELDNWNGEFPSA